jgi:uncharacterized repeat protein (TIGR01451 family)
LTLDNSGAHLFLTQRTLNTGGATTWTGNNVLYTGTGSVINNTGTWDAQGGGTMDVGNFFAVPSTFNNNGTFRKSAGAGTTTIVGPAFNNTAMVESLAGTLRFIGTYVQSSGVTRLNGGNLSSTTTMNIQAGSLQGNGTITGNVMTAGQTSPGLSTGTLTVAGTFTQQAAGAFNVEVAGAGSCTQNDLLVRSGAGSAVVAGTLNVTAVGCTPAHNDSFSIMTYPSQTPPGPFTTVNLPPLAPGLEWDLLYGTTAIVITVGGDITDLSISNTDAPDPVFLGDTLTYMLGVSNAGPDVATGVTVTDSLPAGVSFVSATPTQGSCNQTAGVVTCNLGGMAAAASATITIQVTPAAAGTLTSTASVVSTQFEPVPANNTATVTTTALVPCPDVDNDNYAVCGAGCTARPGDGCGDCADGDPLRHPGRPEQCDGVDNNCNGIVDQELHALPELCNGQDDNCNNLVDENNPQGGVACSTGQAGVCSAGTTTCDQGALACQQNAGPGPELCNGLDDDCDGATDETADSDGDGLDNCVDNCPDAHNPGQGNADGDVWGDVCDCTPTIAGNPAPPAVGAIQVTKPGPGAMTTISWDAVPGATRYHVYRGFLTQGNAPGYNHQCLQAGVNGTSVGDALDPRPYTNFTYYVSSVCGGNNESGLGTNSAGTPVPRPFRCPASSLDDDGDGVEEAADNCPGFQNGLQSDVDSDAHGDVCDNCPAASNPTQSDLDGDLLGDACDPDRDGDGVDNGPDNCPDVPNPGQEDADMDGLGDACDTE